MEVEESNHEHEDDEKDLGGKCRLLYPRLKHRAEIDGLRCLAVVPVVFYHFELSFPGGYTGVDVFFVISGYLVTSILLNQLEVGTFSFPQFFARRIRRLFPALAVVLSAVLVTGSKELIAEVYTRVKAQVVATLLIGANFYFYANTGGYNGAANYEFPLLHCWSLAVEEQFYLVFPLLIWLTWRALACLRPRLPALNAPSSSIPLARMSSQTAAATPKTPTTTTTTAVHIHLSALAPTTTTTTTTTSSSPPALSSPSPSPSTVLKPSPTESPSPHHHITTSPCSDDVTPPHHHTTTSQPTAPTPVPPSSPSPSPPPPWTLNQTTFLVLFCVVVVISFPVCVHQTVLDQSWAFYLLPARAWELALGSLLPVLRTVPFVRSLLHQRVWVECGALLGLVLVIIPYWAFEYSSAFPGYQALLPSLGTALFILSQDVEQGLGGRFLSMKIPVFIGKISYSLYLWHWPVFAFQSARLLTGQLSLAQKWLGVALSTALSLVSYFCVENVFRSKIKVGNRVFYPLVACAYGALLFFALFSDGMGGIGSGGDPSPYPGRPGGGIRWGSANTTDTNATITNATMTNATTTSDPASSGCMYFKSESEVDSLVSVEVADLSLSTLLSSAGWQGAHWCTGTFRFINADNPSILVIGSSHCCQWGNLIQSLAVEYDISVAIKCHNGRWKPSDTSDIVTRVRSESWDLDLIVMFDFWGGDVAFPWWYDGYDFKPRLDLLANVTNRLLMFGDNPTLPFAQHPSSNGVKQWVHNKQRADGNLDFLVSLKEDPAYQKRRELAEEKMRNLSLADADLKRKLDFAEVSSYFKDSSGDLQIVDPITGTLCYKDWGHLNNAGTSRVEQLLRREIFNQEMC